MDGGNHGDLKFRLGCSVFLSHGGADKDFVRFLNEALKNKGYCAFYDEASLPKAVPVSMRNILAELKDVKLAVLVLSNAFFTRTRHPMHELSTIVDANIQMLPVFYEFSVDQFKTKCRNQEWLTTWKEWVDEKLISEDDVTKWNSALNALSDTNGLEYCKEATNTLDLRDKIVAKVCCNVKPDLRWSAEGVQGMDRLCKVVSEMFTKSLQQTHESSVVGIANESRSNQTVVGGMYGIAGIGKSTLCRALCDFFFKEFNGGVCFIELGDCSEAGVRARLESVLFWLTGSSVSPPASPWLSVDQLWNLLKDHMQRCGSRPVFLAIDNVQVGESMDEAEKYLGCGPFPDGSKIFLTSQRADVLKDLLVDHNESCSWLHRCIHLSFAEARKIFLHRMYSREHRALSPQQEHVVNECVSMCTLNKLQSNYFPMMLIVLASYMRRTSQDPVQWQGKLEELRRDGIFASASTHIDKLERIFRLFYFSLGEHQQHMLLDLALYLPDALNGWWEVEDVKKCWLDYIYPCQDVNEILSQLVALSLVESRGMSVIHADKCFRVYDLWREFLKKEGAKSCRWIFKEHQRVKPSWRPQFKSRPTERIGISRCYFEGPTLDLSGIKEIKVLHLIHNKGLERVQLSKTAWSCLQSLIIHTFTPMKILIEERVPKQQQAFFYVDVQNCEITPGASDPSCFLHSNPNSGLTLRNVVSLKLQNVRMNGQLGACLGGFQQLHELELTDLSDLRVNLEFDMCSDIRKIRLKNLPNLEAVSGLENCSNVESFFIKNCSSLRSLVLLDKCAFYVIKKCKGLESMEVRQSQLESTCSLETEGKLNVSGCPFMHNIIGLSRRKFIGTVEYDSSYHPPMKRLKCSPEAVKQMFDISEHSPEQQIKSATIFSFGLEFEGLKRFSMRDVHDTFNHVLALACTSASSLESLQICCNRNGACGCHSPLHQPRFDYFQMALRRLFFECTSVRDLSSLENCSLMGALGLYGCLSVVKWPDFGKMTSLHSLEVICPGSLTYWPSGLQSHPSLKRLRIVGSNQISPEELLEQVTSGNSESCLDCDWISSFAALEILIDDVKFRRKDNLCIAKALMSNNEKLLSIIDTFLIRDVVGNCRNRYFRRVSKLLYGLWVEANCTLHECSASYAEIKGSQLHLQLLQDCLQALLSHKTMISALLREYFSWGPLFAFQSNYVPFENLVLVCFGSIEKFGVLPEEEELESVGDSEFFF